ncbi:MAG TPA: CSLREA domain-containing protein, partial [Saprospiraceae bacterium]|nr:CSLREA domain-containing protein [Saprospiraceae bacterium]
MIRFSLLCVLMLTGLKGQAQTYFVNTANDVDDGVCDGIHCSLREAVRAAEADGAPSTILFAIPGAGPHLISPQGPFPTINQPDLSVIGESQPSGLGSLVIDFNFRNFMGNAFWTVLAPRFSFSGFEIREFLFDNPADHIFVFGDQANPADGSRIRNCVIYDDNSFLPNIAKQLIVIRNADNMVVSNNKFGTNFTNTAIFKLEGYLFVDSTQRAKTVRIDSNIFANKFIMIDLLGGAPTINKNIFGALDTNKAVNFLSPEVAIRAARVDRMTVNDNFFFGIQKNCIEAAPVRQMDITRNRFHFNNRDLFVSGNGNEVSLVANNLARNGKWFLATFNAGDMAMENNDIASYDTVFYNLNDPVNTRIRYIGNRMSCINDKVVVMDPAAVAGHPIPAVTSVNRNQVTGTGRPNDTVIVYSHNRLLCPMSQCQGGVELGRTRANAAGNWILNAAYPNRTSISAYQFESNPAVRPTRYSEFSPCYQCPGPIRIVFDTTLCSGQSIVYRGKNYTEANPKDSLFVRGDGVSICDSVIIVDVLYASNFRNQLNVAVCYEDTLTFGGVQIHKNHLSDSLLLKTAAGCDSVVTINGREVGLRNYAQTICDNAFVNIGGTRFDKNNTT